MNMIQSDQNNNQSPTLFITYVSYILPVLSSSPFRFQSCIIC